MHAEPIRFSDAPTFLSGQMDYGPFDIRFGVLPVTPPVIGAVWRRHGAGQVFEPTSAEFLVRFVSERVHGDAILPSTDDELNAAFRSLPS